MLGRAAINGVVGFAVGVAGGLVGLGGAELRLPYLVGVLRLTPHQAVPVNLAISLLTILAAVPTRLLTLPAEDLGAFLWETGALAAGAVAAAYVGAGWLRRISSLALGRLIFVLLILLGLGMMAETFVPLASDGFLPALLSVRLLAAFLFGLLIGVVSSLLGVAGGEVIIPTLVFAFGAPIKAAGSLSMIVSFPTVLVGVLRHGRTGAYADRDLVGKLIVPMGAGSILGAIAGGLLVGVAPAAFLKLALGALLVWSAWKVFANHD